MLQTALASESVECGGVRWSTVAYPTCILHGLFVLLGKASEHLSLEASGKSQGGQEAHDDHAELPAEIEGNDDGHANVGQRVNDHADLRARGLGEDEGAVSITLGRIRLFTQNARWVRFSFGSAALVPNPSIKSSI